MRTVDMYDKLCDVTPYLIDIIEKSGKDEEVRSLILKIRANKKATVADQMRLLPILMKKYKDEIFNILAIFNDKSVDEIKEQSITDTIKQVFALFNDKDIKDFFMPYLKRIGLVEEQAQSSTTSVNLAEEVVAEDCVPSTNTLIID